MIDYYKLLIFIFVLILCFYMIKLSMFAKKNWHFTKGTFRLVFIGLSFLSIATFLDSFNFIENYPYIHAVKRACFTVGGVLSVIGLIYWMAATKQFIEMIESLSMKDPMLNIYNRRGFYQIFDQVCKKTVSFSVLVCDLNELKLINDTKGHAKGDRYITKASQILEETFGSNGYVARLGGDEFIILYMSYDTAKMDECITTVKQKVSQIFADANTGIGIGVSFYPKEGRDLDSLLKLADSRMYEDKLLQKEV